ncbi:hypothetical protein [Nodosilinea sp. P-1105]|nr:hypothetical protein [Nodosilinea sp. P-1105]
MEFLTVLFVVFILHTIGCFSKPPKPEKTVDEKLSEALAEYVKKGVKIRG